MADSRVVAESAGPASSNRSSRASSLAPRPSPARFARTLSRRRARVRVRAGEVEVEQPAQDLVIGEVFSREPMDRTEQILGQFACPIVRIEMPDGEVVSVAARITKLNEESLATLRNFQIPIGAIKARQTIENVSATLMNDPSQDTPLFLTSIQGFDLIRRE
jgi:hypothetical protein